MTEICGSWMFFCLVAFLFSSIILVGFKTQSPYAYAISGFAGGKKIQIMRYPFVIFMVMFLFNFCFDVLGKSAPRFYS